MQRGVILVVARKQQPFGGRRDFRCFCDVSRPSLAPVPRLHCHRGMNTTRNQSRIRTSFLLLLAATAGCAPARFENEHASPSLLRSSPAAVPQGMRRTKNGWEDASLWSLPAGVQTESLDGWLKRQRAQEPGWVRRAMEEIRETPPWMVAAIQISAIAAIVHIGRRKPAEQAA